MHPHVALHNDSGVIYLTQEDTGNYGEDGSLFDGLIVHRIYDLYEAENLGDFMQKYVWCTEIDWWKRVPDKPNAYAYWDATLTPPAWNWDPALLLEDVRIERNTRLFNSDWTQMNDSPLSDTEKAAWANYRQALRDITTTLTGSEQTLEDVQWPSEPSN